MHVVYLQVSRQTIVYMSWPPEWRQLVMGVRQPDEPVVTLVICCRRFHVCVQTFAPGWGPIECIHGCMLSVCWQDTTEKQTRIFYQQLGDVFRKHHQLWQAIHARTLISFCIFFVLSNTYCIAIF